MIVAWAEDITVVELLWARSLLVSQVALEPSCREVPRDLGDDRSART